MSARAGLGCRLHRRPHEHARLRRHGFANPWHAVENLHPFCSPVIGPFYTYFGVFRQPTKSCKKLETLVINALKRPASAVQSRPWTPHSKEFSYKLEKYAHPQFTRD